MEVNKQPNNLTELLEKYKDEPLPMLIQLSLSKREEGYLVKEVVKKTMEACADKVSFLKIVDPMATRLGNELQIYRNPIFLIIFRGKLRAIHHGVIGSGRLISSINRINTISITKKATPNEAA